MYTAIKGIYQNDQVILEELPPTIQKSKVVVIFIPEEEPDAGPVRLGVRLGSLAGKGHAIPEDFNDPLDDFAEYQ